jgi:hypothetical protein
VNLQDFNVLASRFGAVLTTARGGAASIGTNGDDDEEAELIA